MAGRSIAAALAAAALFGLTTPLAKLLLGSIDGWVLAGLLYLGAGLGLAPLLARPHTSESKPTRADWPWLAGVAVFGGLLAPVLLMLGLQHTGAASAALLLNLEVVFTLAIAWAILREPLDRRLALGAVAILAGGVLLAAPTGPATWSPGAVFIALACLAWGIDNTLQRRLAAIDPVVVVVVKGCAAGSVNLGLALAFGAALPPLGSAALALLVGALGYGASIVLFLLALRHLGLARTSAYFALGPFVGAIAAVVWLDEPVTALLALAAVLFAIGVWLHVTEQHGHEHEHDVLDHDHRHRHDDHHDHAHDPPVPPGTVHAHPHRHQPLRHAHAHYPDLHHRHRH